MSEETLQIAEKRREVKGKGEKERYTHLKAKFQRIPRRDKKAFLSYQCKEIEEKDKLEGPGLRLQWGSGGFQLCPRSKGEGLA